MKMKFWFAAFAALFVAGTAQAATYSLTWTGGGTSDADGYYHFDDNDNWSGGTFTMSDANTYNFSFPATSDEVKILMPDGGGTLSDGGKKFGGTLTFSDDAKYLFYSTTKRTYQSPNKFSLGSRVKVTFANLKLEVGGNADSYVVAPAGSLLVFDGSEAVLGGTVKTQNSYAGDIQALNGSIVNVPTFTIAENAKLDIINGSCFESVKTLKLSAGSTTVIENSTLKCSGANATTIAGDVVFRGANARFCFTTQTGCASITGASSGARLIFVVPEGGYNSIPFSASLKKAQLPIQISFAIRKLN